jgi:2-polyprenyl-3-methyl-5-hydroxy-6-metoxy-1,4-benzoquinol methylase
MSVRKEHWEKVYQTKSPDEVSWYQPSPILSLQLIANTRLAFDAPIIDIGGGASTLVGELCDSGYSNVSVLDVSASALAHAKHRYADKVSEVRWYEEDVTCFKPPHRFALWHDRAVFHFLTSRADRDSYIKVLKQSIEPGGHIIMMTFAIDGPKKCSGLDIVQYDADKLILEFGPGFELVETGFDVHLTPTGNQQKFAYFRFLATPENV